MHPLLDYTVGMTVDVRAVNRALKQHEGVLKEIYKGAMTSAVEASFSRRKMGELKDAMSGSFVEMKKNLTELNAIETQLRKGGLGKEMAARLEGHKKELKNQRALIREQANAHFSSARAAAVEYSKIVAKEKIKSERRGVAAKSMGRWYKGSKGTSGGLMTLFQQMTSGDVGGAMSTVGKGGKAAREALINKQKRGGMGAGAAGGTLKAFKGIGTALAALGPALIAIGLVVGALAVLVKVFMAADKAVTEMNSSLLKANVSAADLGAGWMDLDDKLKEIRGAFTDTSYMMAWKVLPKEAMKIVDAYGAAGVKVSQFTQGIQTATARQEQLRKVTETALTYANLVGMTGTDVATKMGEYMDNLSMSLESVREGFSGIYRVANESGYSTKKFFGMVLQATSGLSMYNVRLEETATLLNELTSALGLKDGFALLQKLLGMSKSRSVKEGAKGVTASAGGAARRHYRMRIEAEKKFETFLKEMHRTVSGSMFEGAAREAKVKLDISSAKGLVDSLLKLSHADYERLEGSLLARARTKDQKNLIKSLRNDFLHFLPGLKGNAVAQAGAEAHGGPVFQFLTALDRLAGATQLAKQSVANVHGYGLIAGENAGFDKATQQQLASLVTAISSKFKYMQGLAEKVKSVSDINAETQRDLAKTHGMIVHWNKDTQKAEVRKATVSKTGMLTVGDKPITRVMDYLYSSQEVLRELTKKSISKEIALAQTTANKTTEATKILGAIKDKALFGIFNVVTDIFAFMRSDQSSEAGQLLAAAFTALRGGVRGKISATQDELANVRDMLPTATPYEKKALEAVKADLEVTLASYQIKLKRIEERGDFLQTMQERDPEQFKLIVNTAGSSRNAGGDWNNLNDNTKEFLVKLATGSYVDRGDHGADGAAPVLSTALHGSTKLEGANISSTGTVIPSTGNPAVKKSEIVRDKLMKRAVVLQKIADAKAAKLLTTAEKARGDAAQKNPAKIADEIVRKQALERVAIRKLIRLLGRGMPNTSRVIRKDIAGELRTGSLSPDRESWFRSKRGIANTLLNMEDIPEDYKGLIRKALAGPVAHDMILGLSEGRVNFAHRIDSKDQLGVLAKPGGALSGAGGGATVIHNNFWEGKGAFNSLRQLEKARGQFR